MQAIDFYCKKCRKSMRISYALTGDRTAPAMNGIIMYILSCLEPDSRFEVEILETVLRGAEHCRFRITKN